MPMSDETPVVEAVTMGASAGYADATQRSSVSVALANLCRELWRLRNWAPSGALAVLDQGLISTSNFVLGVALARWGGVEAYGAYMVMFAAFLLIANLYQALLIDPCCVLAYSLFPSNSSRYLRVLLRMHVIFSVCFVTVAGTVLLLAPRLNIRGPLLNALTGLLIATPLVLLFWLARSFAYVEFSPGRAVTGSVAYCGMLVAGLATAYTTGGLTPQRVFVCTACGAAVASVCLLFRYRRNPPSADNEPALREVWRRHWKYGRWGLGTVAVGWAQINSLSFTGGYFLGLKGIGGLNALTGLLLPMVQVQNAAARIALPRIAQRFTLYGAGATHRPVIRAAAAVTVLTAAYWLALTLMHGTLLRLVYGDRFLAYAHLVPVMGFAVLGWAAIIGLDVGFNSIQQPQAAFPLKILMVAITVLVGTAMSWRFGLTGAAIAVPACTTMTAVCMGLRLRALWRQQCVSATAGADYSQTVN
jgi:O-antigen/teichoic acid export membrane protein